jgi:glycosyltransferase involved in cell wall biosynthesis
MVNILMIISEAPPIKSGVARVAEKLSRGLRGRGYAIEILSLKDIPRYEYGELRISSMPLKVKNLKNKLRQYDIIHLHGPVPTFSDVFLLWGLRGLGTHRPRLVYTHHAPIEFNNPFLRPVTQVYNLIQERLARLADHVVVTTPTYGQRLTRFVPMEKLSVIPWGVEYAKYSSDVDKSDPFTVVYLGQIRPYKGLPILLEAARGLQDSRIWVIGNGHATRAYQQIVEKLGLNDVTFWGGLPDEEVIPLIKRAHVVVLPSTTRSEAFGIALLEGMAAGLVPVASHLPGVADLVGNEGFTFPPGNSQDLRSILLRLRDDPLLRRHIARLAQAKAKLYSWDRTVFGYEQIFKGLTEQKEPAGSLVSADIPGSTMA